MIRKIEVRIDIGGRKVISGSDMDKVIADVDAYLVSKQ